MKGARRGWAVAGWALVAVLIALPFAVLLATSAGR